jgi:hypothetical protein
VADTEKKLKKSMHLSKEAGKIKKGLKEKDRECGKLKGEIGIMRQQNEEFRIRNEEL